MVVLWLGGMLSGRVTLVIVLITLASLLLTHTRTALVGMIAGIIVAGLSLFKVRARARKLFASLFVVVSIGALTLSGVVTTYLDRGESSQQLTDLTGRTNVWSQILTAPRDEFQVFFGFGLSNLSFNGLSVDSNWLGAYLDLGLFGVAVCAVLLVYMLVAGVPPAPRPAARTGLVPRGVLPGVVVHRDRAQRPLAVSSRPQRGRVIAGAADYEQESLDEGRAGP